MKIKISVWMNSFILFSLLIGSLVCNAAGPDIAFDKLNIDFGTVQGGTVLKHTFKFKNTGDQDLTITKIEAPCGCTAVQTAEGSIKPGQWGELAAQVNTSGYHDKFEKYIYVNSNVPHMPRVTLIISAIVVYDIEVKPFEFVPFYNIKAGDSSMRELQIVNNTAKPLAVSSPVFTKNPDNSFSFKLEEVKKGIEYKLTINFKAGEKPGNILGELKLATNNKNKPEIVIPISAYVLDEVYVSPRSVVIQRKDKNTARFRTLTITNTGKTVLKITDVEIDSPHLVYKLDPIPGTMDFNLTITVNKDAPAAILRGEIKIKTNNAKYPIVKVPYYISEE